MKKQAVFAFCLLLLIPVVVMAGGFLSSMINPEWAAGHANYPMNFRLLTFVKTGLFLGSGAVAALLWLSVCLLLIQSKQRSLWWLLCAALGPFGLAILATLDDKESAGADRYSRFVRSLNIFVRVGYEVCRFVLIWLLAAGLTLAWNSRVAAHLVSAAALPWPFGWPDSVQWTAIGSGRSRTRAGTIAATIATTGPESRMTLFSIGPLSPARAPPDP